MKLAYWKTLGSSYTLLISGTKSLYLIRSNGENVYIYGYYHLGIYQPTLYFDTLKEAVLECERGARSAGYRILTEAELNLL